MRNVFLLPIITCSLLICHTTTFAQAPASGYRSSKALKETPQQKLEDKVTKIDTVVQLSPAQKNKTRNLLQAIYDEKQQNKITANGDRDKLKELNQQTNIKKEKGLKKILTKQQFNDLKAAKKNKHEESAE